MRTRFTDRGAILALAVLAAGCSDESTDIFNSSDPPVEGSGNVIEEMRQVDGVTGVTQACVGDLVIEIGDDGELNGVIRERQDIVSRLIPEPTKEEKPESKSESEEEKGRKDAESE